jgi:hypothetical protein
MTKLTPEQFEEFKRHANNTIQLLLKNEMNKHTIKGIRLAWDAKPFDEESLKDRREVDREVEFLSAIADYVSEWIMEAKQKE